MSRVVVVSQPMYFPWVGLFEQIRLADVFVYYDDVQFSKGGFLNRVQIKTPQGFSWLTVPLSGASTKLNINATQIENARPWRAEQRKFLAQNYARAPFVAEMLALVDQVFAQPASTLAEIAIASMDAVCDYLQLKPPADFLRSSQLNVAGQNNSRLLALVQQLEGTTYVTGHGAKNYLDHDAFEQAGIHVAYMNYEKRSYPQLHGPFNPYVSILDLIANVGRAGREVVASGTLPWRQMLAA